MQKSANSTVISTSLLIGFTFTIFEIFAKQHVYLIPCFLTLETLFEEHVKLIFFQFFFAVVCKSYDWLISFNKKTPQKNAV